MLHKPDMYRKTTLMPGTGAATSRIVWREAQAQSQDGAGDDGIGGQGLGCYMCGGRVLRNALGLSLPSDSPAAEGGNSLRGSSPIFRGARAPRLDHFHLPKQV